MKRRAVRMQSVLVPAFLLSFSLALSAINPARADSFGWKLITYERIQLQVPADWPVIDLAARPKACVRFDVHAVYLGPEGREPDCPAHVVGRTDTVHVESLDSRAIQAISFPATATKLNGEVAYLSTSTSSGRIAAAFPQLAALVSLSVGPDSALGDRILSTIRHAPGTNRLSETSLPKSSPEPASANVPLARSPSTRAPKGPGTIYTGKGFDTCTAPSTDQMTAWLSSPYRSAGIYIGGIERGCDQPNLTPSWIATVESQGWNLVPTYVGLQAPCTNYEFRINPKQAGPEGVSAADDAASQAQALDISPGNPIYFDMEAYDDSNSGCVQAVLNFISAWVGELHAKGYIAAMYGGAASGIRDEANIYNDPRYNRLDDIWNADWDGRAQVFGDPYFPDSVWPDHQRLHQYWGGHNETWGGVTLNIDNDYDDGAVVSNAAAAGSALTSYVLGSTAHVMYLDASGNVRELWWGSGWHVGFPMVRGAPPAASGSPLTSYVLGSTTHVMYLDASGNVRELWWGSGWHVGFPMVRGAPPAASGSPLTSYVLGSTTHVIYLDASGNVRELWWNPSGWHVGFPMVRGAPPAASGSPLTSYVLGSAAHVMYLDASGNVRELWWGSGWHVGFPMAPGAPPAATGSALTSYLLGSTAHLMYLDTGGSVHELWWNPSGWHVGFPMVRGAPPAAAGSALTSYVLGSTTHVIYLDASGSVRELWWNPSGWHVGFPMVRGAPPAAAGSALTSYLLPDGSSHIMYLDAGGNVRELWWNSAGWHVGR